MAGFMGILGFLGGKQEYQTRKATYKDNVFTLEVADTFRKLSAGLMKRESIPKDGGMLFVFKDDARHGIWMLNMKISIDIIWLDKNFEIVHIWRNAQPCPSIFSCPVERPAKDARYVIELNAGSAKKYAMKLGEKISFNV